MKDSWCSSLHYKGKKLSGGAARNVRISSYGGMDKIIEDVAIQILNKATLAANQAENGKIIQMPKQRKAS